MVYGKKVNGFQSIGGDRASQLISGKRIHLPMQEMQETRVQSLGQEHPLEEEMVTHFSILASEISWTEESGGL